MVNSDARKHPNRRLLIGAGTNWMAFAATLVVAFFLTPYLVGKLGDGQFGVWAFVESILAYFTLFDLGIAACVVRFVARFEASGDRDDLNRLVSTALAMFLGLGIILFAVGSSVLPLLLSSLGRAGLPQEEIIAFALLMLGNLAVTLPLSVFPSILDGLQRFALKSSIRIASLIVRTIGIVLVMEYRPSLLNLGILYTVCNLVEHAILVAAAYRCLPGLQFRRRLIDWATLKRIKGYSLHAFLAMVAGRTCVQSGTILVGFFLGASPVAYFAIALRLVEFAKALLRTATNTLTPAVSALEATGDSAAILRMFLKGTRWVLYMVLPIQLGLIVFGRPFLEIWLNDPAYAEHCYPALLILSSTLSLVVAQSIAARILYGLGHLRSFARAALLEALANVVLGVVLCPRFGLIGVAFAMAIPNFVMCVWVIQHAARRIDMPVADAFRAWIAPLLFSTIPLVTWLLLPWQVGGWGAFVISLGCGLAPFVLAVLLFESSWSTTKRLFAPARILQRVLRSSSTR